MSALLAPALVCVATYRLTRLLVADKVLSRPRGWVEQRKPEGSLAYFVTCPWCVGLWCSVPVAWTGLVWGDQLWWQVPALALSASAVTGFLSTLVGLMDSHTE